MHFDLIQNILKEFLEVHGLLSSPFGTLIAAFGDQNRASADVKSTFQLHNLVARQPEETGKP